MAAQPAPVEAHGAALVRAAATALLPQDATPNDTLLHELVVRVLGREPRSATDAAAGLMMAMARLRAFHVLGEVAWMKAGGPTSYHLNRKAEAGRIIEAESNAMKACRDLINETDHIAAGLMDHGEP